MKNIMFFLITTSMILAEGISGLSYFNYATGDASNDEAHGFAMNRVYFTYKTNVSETTSFKFQADVLQQEGDGLQMYLKNAKMDYMATENITFIYGLQGMNVFKSQEKIWGNRFLSKSAMDLNKWSPSADLGLAVKLSMGCPIIKSNKVSGSLLFTNGEGYKNDSSDGNERISAALGYKHNIGEDMNLQAGGSFSTLSYDAELDDSGAEVSAEGTATIMALYGGFSGFGLRTGFEYNMGTDLNLEGYGADAKLMSYYGTYNLTFIDGLSLIVRYDSLDNGADDDDQTDVDESADTAILLTGLSYKCAEGITFAPNMTQTTVGDDDPTTALNLTFMFKF
tara:strand:- start:1656 stop:2669 length:1014 start_codon:yes stop_codon:yes gene_type:complete